VQQGKGAQQSEVACSRVRRSAAELGGAQQSEEACREGGGAQQREECSMPWKRAAHREEVQQGEEECSKMRRKREE
jgi:hypothetical protein